jgi:hypothetical protein
LDSIVKGYPIGTFILWKTKESLRAIRNIPDEIDMKGQQEFYSDFEENELST